MQNSTQVINLLYIFLVDGGKWEQSEESDTQVDPQKHPTACLSNLSRSQCEATQPSQALVGPERRFANCCTGLSILIVVQWFSKITFRFGFIILECYAKFVCFKTCKVLKIELI